MIDLHNYLQPSGSLPGGGGQAQEGVGMAPDGRKADVSVAGLQKSLQKVRVTGVQDFVSVEQISVHMAKFGHVLIAEGQSTSSFP